MKLFVLRHGQAEAFAASDAQRALTETGRREVRSVVSECRQELAAVDRVWVSPLRRARQTLDLVLEAIGERPCEVCDWLLPESSPTAVLEQLASRPEGEISLLVGHQPLFGDLVNNLCGEPRGYYSMPTAALACLEFDYPAPGCGRLLWLK